MDIKQILKKLKLVEQSVSSLMGVLVVLVVAFLIFKYFQGLGKSLPSGVKPEENQQKQAELGPGRTHLVENGESLWKISLKYYNTGYNWVDIAKENMLVNPNAISAGTTLVIPDVAPKLVNQKPTAVSKQLTPITENEYHVVRGDNLWTIAVRAYGDGFRWTEIAQVNKLVNPNLIHSGNTLAIPR